jgi:hypothetical protein
MLPRSELIDIVNGLGRLEVRGSASAFGLFVDGHPVAANWYDCEGSIGQYFYRVPDCSVEQSAALAREAVQNALPPDHLLSDGFWPLLNQFACGPYRLDYDEVGPDLQFQEVDYTADLDATAYAYQYANYSRLQHVLLPTQATSTRDQDCILAWAAAIESGRRPTIVTTMLDGADSEIVLDGHHKFAAYELVDVLPRRLTIVPLSPAPLRLTDWPGGRMPEPPVSWPKALALKPRVWPQDADSANPYEYQRRAAIAQRLGLPVPNLIGFLEASYAYLYDYSPDYQTKDLRGWITSPARLELLDPRAQLGLEGNDIVKVSVINSRTSSAPGLVGWIPLIAQNCATRQVIVQPARIDFAPV